MSFLSHIFSSPSTVFISAFLLRLSLLIYGIYQDAHSVLKYTDIDYYVFTDAARFLAHGRPPYERATYRYTPLLAWMLIPTTWGGPWFHFGKALFAVSDIVAGWLILTILRRKGLDQERALKYASVWLLNPMVANISTRGSSEGLLCVLVMATLWAFEMGRVALAGMLLGASVHFKIYPFIYGASMLWALESVPNSSSTRSQRILHFLNRQRIVLLLTSLTTFTALNVLMYFIYGKDFITHTFTYHLTRLDHRHNFSPYNTILYLSSAATYQTTKTSYTFASLAFVPQLILSCVFIPLACAKSDLSSTLLAQTLAFVAFNKVATSQYFLWYLVFLSLYLPNSSLMRDKRLGVSMLSAWVAGQAVWLSQGYQLEFLGRSTFVPGLWGSSLVFLAVNAGILGIVVSDVVQKNENENEKGGVMRTKSKIGSGRVLVMPPANTNMNASTGSSATRSTSARRRKG